ncbi:MAG: cardiolipin synthase [Sphingomonas bacterium]
MAAHPILLALLVAAHAAAITRSLLVESRNPYSRAAWLLVLLLMPVIGVLAYVLFGEPWVARRLRREAKATANRIERRAEPGTPSALDQVPERFAAAFRICERIGHWPVVGGNRAAIAADSNAAIDAMVADFDAARATIHISFYIWLTDHNGVKVIEALKRAAGRGVVCRVVVDAIGSRALTRSPYWRAMRDAGVRLCISLPAHVGIPALAGSRIDLRNHRKIVVVDDRVTYCGSQNCADPEFRIKPKFAPWVDIMLRFEGPVVRQNQLLFADDWMIETGEDLIALLPPEPDSAPPGGFPAIAFGTGPMSAKGAMSDVFVASLYGAEREVVVSTPYFVPDPPLVEALIACARRGVETVLILPARNDSAVVGAMGRANYAQLIEAGVRIFEFRGGLLHAKTLVADGIVALIGSANMDRRSLELNFENNILLACPDLAMEIRGRQHVYLDDAHEVTAEDIRSRPLRHIFWQNLLTIFAPIF